MDPTLDEVMQLLSQGGTGEDLNTLLLKPEGKMQINDPDKGKVGGVIPLKKDASTIARIQKKYPEFSASVDKNGQLNISGTGSPSSTPTIENKGINLQSRMQSLESENDPIKA